jgi:tetratricopeptide (TPR) repeat protein
VQLIFRSIACLLLLAAINLALAEDAAITYDRLGLKLYSARNYTEALSYFNQSLDQNSSNVDVWVHKGDALKALNRLNESIDSYYQAIDLDGRKVAAWSGLTDIYATNKDYVNATIAAAKATQFDNRAKTNWFREGSLLQKQGMFREAIPKFDGALKLDAKYKDALYGKAMSLVAMNNIAEASKLLDQVLALDPRYKSAYNLRGQILESQGRYADALTSYNKALDLDPKYGNALNNKMHVLLILKRYGDAMNVFLKLGN